MRTKIASSYNDFLQALADEYFEETGKERATTKEIAVWAIQNDKWSPPPDLIISKCREDLSRALREQYIKDDQGRSVRAKHAARISEDGHQETFWADIRCAPRMHMTLAFQQRRRQIVGDCRQLKLDLDYYNDAHLGESPIQMVFNFEDDLEEMEFSGEFPPRKPR